MAFVDSHRALYGAEPTCRVLPVAPSTYYAHAARRAEPRQFPPRTGRNAILCEAVRHIWEENFGVHGVRKVWRQLQRECIQVAQCTAFSRDEAPMIDELAFQRIPKRFDWRIVKAVSSSTH